ncbi:MAG: phosphodiesterase [Hyphomicrobiales bacterium]|nr:phosphodiesterase [Hyphomicrobiales bacterium]MCP5370741.1 phosphodiesterase [Hyphomicrobiales bacterium]
MKFIHVTDPHLVPAGQRLFDLDPVARLDACVADINAHHGDADLCVITGDLADRGEAAAYGDFRRCLDRLELPWHLLVGNHDARGTFRRAFPETAVDRDGFVQSVVETAVGDFLLLDTVAEGTHAGAYCPVRAAWLRARLEERRDRDVYLFMHHPPFDLHIPCLDDIGILDKGPIEGAVAGFSHIRHLFFGHAHRPIAGSWRGIPFTTMRGTNHGVPFDLTTRGQVPKSHEPPAYAVAWIDDDRVVVHFHDYLDRTTLVPDGEGFRYLDS